MKKSAKQETRRPTHPGVLLGEDVLPALSLTTAQAAEALGVSRTFLYKLLAGEVPMSAEMCLKVGKLAGNGARLWMNMQAHFNLWQAEHDPKVTKSLRQVPSYKELMRA